MYILGAVAVVLVVVIIVIFILLKRLDSKEKYENYISDSLSGVESTNFSRK